MLSIAMFIGFLTLVSCDKQASNESDAYDYPVKGGTNEWRKLTSHDEMLEVCQIPDTILKRMSTAGLVETVLNYPLSGDMYAYSNLQQGFDAMTSQFNGLAELLNRSDAGTQLLVKYNKSHPLNGDNTENDFEIIRSSFNLGFLEMILSQRKIILSLSLTQKEDLLTEATIRYNEKLRQKDLFGRTSGTDTSKALIDACK